MRGSEFPIRAIPPEHLLNRCDVFCKMIVEENTLLPVHRAFVWHNISLFGANRTCWFAVKERKNRSERFSLFLSELFELYGLHLLARKKFKDALELSSVKSAIDVGKTPGVNWRRATDAGLFFSNGVKEVQRFAAFKSLHIPMGKCAFDRVSQNDEQFDVRIVIPDSFRGRLMIKITGGAITGHHRRSKRRIVFVEILVIHR